MTVMRPFGFAIGGITRLGEDDEMGVVLFLRWVEDGPPFFQKNFALLFFACDDHCAVMVDDVIAGNIPLQLL